MKGNLLAKITRFRAYQLGTHGSSFSYFDGESFTLIEARLTDLSRPRVDKEMEICGVSRIGCLHITSWDADHCTVNDLKEILKRYRPHKIEYPGYDPSTETGTESLALIKGYKSLQTSAVIQSMRPEHIDALHPAEELGYKDIVYHPKYLSDNANDNSTVKLFRTGCFNVASLGDVEDNMISARLCNSRIFSNEVDVMILSHHGADNGFTTSRFLKTVKPTVAICSSNYDNKFDHPKPEIRALLAKYGIPIYTTKTGDVALQSLAPHTHAYRLINLKADSTERSSEREFKSKKAAKLRHNIDSVRNAYASARKPFPA